MNHKIETKRGILNLALVEPVISENPTSNFKNGESGVSLASELGASLIALPELWVTGFGKKIIKKYFQVGLEKDVENLKTICEENEVDLVYGFPEKITTEKYYNCLNIPRQSKSIAYRKLMVYKDVEVNFKESLDFDGNYLAFRHKTPKPVEEEFIIALQLCADLRFPEISRTGALLEADLILNCSQWRDRPRLDDAEMAYPEHWDVLLQARAIENQVYVAGCGALGTARTYFLHGNSAVYDPVGKKVAPIFDIPIEIVKKENGKEIKENGGKVLFYQLDMSRVKIGADEQAEHFIPWIKRMTPIINNIGKNTYEFLNGKPKKHEVFLVHGHGYIKDTVARFLEKLDLKVTVLKELPNEGKSIIEKFELNSNVDFAVVLLTGDDKGGITKTENKNLKLRARQNVIFELGYFIAKLGRKNVCALYQEGIEIPSDYSGVLYIPLDESDAWKTKLAREMKEAHFDIDLNKIGNLIL